MNTAVTIQETFLVSAYELPKDVARKIFKALRNFVREPQSAGLHIERLNGKASNLFSVRVDDNYRIIYLDHPDSPVILFVGKHEDAYRFADRFGSRIQPQPAVALPLRITSDKNSYRAGIDSLDVIACASNITESELAEQDLRHGIGKVEIARAASNSVVAVLDHLEELISSRKYLPLAQYLFRLDQRNARLGFRRMETILGASLPKSAKKYRAWWGNEVSSRHVQASSWMCVGWKVMNVDLQGESVEFERFS